MENEEINRARANAAQARAEARALDDIANMLEAHAEGLHDDAPREGCPECDDKANRT